jgi:glycosyltransferase involved in cell wall biosynthesis
MGSEWLKAPPGKAGRKGAKRLKIAQIAPLYEAVPPLLYGGTERVVAHVCDALVAAGHDVTLFASADALTTAKLEPVRDTALRLDPRPLKSELASHLSLMHRLRERAGAFDILHFHTDLIHFPFFEDLADRSITTIHGRLDISDLPLAYANWRQYPLVSISHHQRRPLPGANWVDNIPHGIPAGLCRLVPQPQGDYLAFLGRIAPDKRPDRAIEIAKRAGMRLKIAAKIDQADTKYYHEEIEKLLDDPMIDFIGEIDDARKTDFLGNATALLFPIDWPEPFGLVMIEAMACGTPVIAWNCGGVHEIIDPGVTGLIVNSLEEAARAVPIVAGFDRRRIRDVFDVRFSLDVMANRYLDLYRRQLAGHAFMESEISPISRNGADVAAYSIGT